MCVLNYHYTSLMLNSGLLIANRIEDFVIIRVEKFCYSYHGDYV